MKTKRIRIGIYAAIVAMALTGSSQAAVQIVDHRPDVYGGNERSNRGRIAMKSTGPVIVLGTTTGNFQYQYTENLTSWISRSEAWATGGASSLDIAVDPITDEAHIVYASSGNNQHPRHVNAQTGTRTAIPPTDNGVWSVGSSGQVQIAVNNDGVTVAWHPRTNFGGGDNWGGEAHYSTSTNGGTIWTPVTAETLLDHPSMMLNPKLLASADELYYYALPRDNAPGSIAKGPYYQQVDDGILDNYVALNQGNSPGYGRDTTGYGVRLSPAWNGTAMNLASVENKPGNQTGVVALYLGIDGINVTDDLVVYDDSADHGGVGTANSVGLAAINGANYVFFTAADPGAVDPNIDTEVFVQVVAQDGTLVGSAQQLTNDQVDQYELDVVVGNASIHLVFTSDDRSPSEAGQRISYMKVSPDPATCEEARQFGFGIASDLTGDCYVLIDDFATLASEYLDCVDPTDNNCDTPWAP